MHLSYEIQVRELALLGKMVLRRRRGLHPSFHGDERMSWMDLEQSFHYRNTVALIFIERRTRPRNVDEKWIMNEKVISDDDRTTGGKKRRTKWKPGTITE